MYLCFLCFCVFVPIDPFSLPDVRVSVCFYDCNVYSEYAAVIDTTISDYWQSNASNGKHSIKSPSACGRKSSGPHLITMLQQMQSPPLLPYRPLVLAASSMNTRTRQVVIFIAVITSTISLPLLFFPLYIPVINVVSLALV